MRLYVAGDSDSIYLDLTPGTGSPVRSSQMAIGIWAHLDAGGNLVGIEVFDFTVRGGLDLSWLGDVPVTWAMPATSRN